jgi:2-oxoacid:acceptor oxidoreductase delta subunit (pyruvate/2-ketoisovalerate family)
MLDHAVTDIEIERREGGFDAVFLGVGAQLARRIEIPAGDSSRVLDAVTLLHQVAKGDPPSLGRRVAIYGGGDTALDAARTARRLGASEAVIVYRRNREHMPAHGDELEEALGEGVTTRWLSTVNRFEGERLVLEKMRLNAEGFPESTGEFEELDADSLILALGQDTDLALLDAAAGITTEDGVIEIRPSMMTGEDGVFAGGDVAPSTRTATVALGHGKRAAHGIDAYLAGKEFAAPARHELATFDHINTWYYADAPRTRRQELERARRMSTFDEIVEGLTEENALFEARRCLSCGNCFGCDNCFGVCPDNAVIKLDNGTYEIDYDFCKGCGMCAKECPCGAIDMIPERI